MSLASDGTLLIVRELLLGPRRYGQLHGNLKGMGTNLLAARLKEMEEHGLIEKIESQYRLTADGYRLEPVVHALVQYGLSLGIKDDGQRLTRPEWDAVALRAMYDANSDAAADGRYQLELSGEPLCIDKVGTDLQVSAVACEAPKAHVQMSKATAMKLVRGQGSFDDGVRQGQIKIVGSRREAKRLLAAFGAGAKR